MQKYLLTFILGACFAFCVPTAVFSQIIYPADSSIQVVVQTSDGNEFVGKILSDNTEFLVLQTEDYHALTIRKQVIKTLRPINAKKMIGGKYWYDNPHASRYFAGPSAFGIPKGQGYFESGLVIFNQISYGFSEHFSVGVGFAPLIFFDEAMPVWIVPKLSIPIVPDKITVALGGIYGRVFNSYESGQNTFGAFYGLCTLGSPEANISGGFGFSNMDNTWLKKPVFALSGMLRTARWFSLMSENYLIRGSYDTTTLLSIGGRFMFRRVALDSALGLPFIANDGVYPFPWIGLHLLFGKLKN